MDGVHFRPKVNANLFKTQINPLRQYAQTRISDSPLTSLYHQASRFVHTCTVMAGSVADTLNSARESMQEAAVSLSGEAPTAVASFGSRVQGAVAEAAQGLWDTIFVAEESEHVYVDPTKIETKPWTGDTATFNLALIGKINPQSEGAFRVGGSKTEVLQRVGDQKIDHDGLSTEAASSTLKESLRQRPLYTRGEAMQKTDHLVNKEGEFIGTPEETYRALTSSLSPEKKQVFDQLIGLFSEVVENKDTNLMSLSNLAIAFGPTLFPEGSSEGLSIVDGIAFAGENTKRQTALFEKLIDHAADHTASQKDLKGRIASLEEKEGKNLEKIEPAKVYTALTEGLSPEKKALFDGEIEILRNEAKNKEILGGKPYGNWKQTKVGNSDRSLVILLIDPKHIQNTSLGISGGSPEALETNKILVDKLLRADS